MHDVGGLGFAEALDLHVVLVAPEVRHHHQLRRLLPEHRGHQHPGLFGDVAPVLDAGLVSGGIGPGRDVAERPDSGDAGTPAAVAEHPAIGGQGDPAAVQPLGGRARADADHHQVGRQFGAVAQQHPGDLTVGAVHGGHTDTGAHVDTLGAVQPGHQFPDSLTEHHGQRRGLRLDEHHVDPERAQAGGDLAADEPGADHHRPAHRAGVLAQGDRLIPGPQHPDPVEIRQRRNPFGHQAGRDHHLVVGQFAAVGQDDGPRGGVQCPRCAAQSDGDGVLGVELRRLERDVLERPLGVQHVLGQRRPVVGQVGLVADEGHRPGELGLAQLLGQPGGGQSAADDHHTVIAHAAVLTRA